MNFKPVSDLSVCSFSSQAFERCKKFGERNSNAISFANHRVAFGTQRGDGQRHGDSMIACRLNFGASQFSGGAPFHAQAIRKFFHARAHPAQSFGNRGDAVAFFHAQFLRAMDFNSLLSERARAPRA